MPSWDAQVRAALKARFKGAWGEQAALARQLSLHDQSWLSRYAEGEFSMDVQTLQEICEAWHVTIQELTVGPLPELTPVQAEARELVALWPHVDAEVRPALLILARAADTRKRSPGGQSSGGSPPVQGPTTKESAPERRRKSGQ